MKARIIGDIGTMYYGEVFIEGRWEKVTEYCFTRFVAKLQLKRWAERHTGFDI